MTHFLFWCIPNDQTTAMPLTEAQRRALLELRAQFASIEIPLGTAVPFDERARLPASGLPDDMTARVEIAPPLSTAFPLLDNSALKSPERVPVFYYSLRGEDAAPRAREDTTVIFFIHGGGNLDCHPADPRYFPLFSAILREVSAKTDGSAPCTVIAPCYRLARIPENTFPAALQDILAAYDFVISQGYQSSNITIAGDSSGGNHGKHTVRLSRHDIDRALQRSS